MPGFVAAAVATAVFSGSTFSVAAGLTLGFSWSAFAGAIILGGASSLLTSKPKTGGGALPSFDRQAQDRTVTVQEAVGKGKIHFGRLRLGGVRTLVEKTGGDNGTLHILITLSANPLKGMDELWFNDEIVPLDASGHATGNYAGYAKAWFGDGTQAGDAALNSALKSALPALWTDAHKQTGCGKLYVQLIWNSDKYANGVPNMTAVCLCEAAIYDPRDASTGWTDNAALVASRYMTIAQNAGGFGASLSEIDAAELSAAANVSDEIVPLRAKQTTFTANAGTDLLTLADGDMNLTTGSRVRVSSTGALPGGLTAATDYFFIVVGFLTGKLAATEADAKAGTPIDLSSVGTGTHTIRVATNFTADSATDRIALADTSARLRTGTVVRLFTDGTLPGGLATGTDYFFSETGSKTGGLATSLKNARNRTLIDITSAGTGTHQIVAVGEPRYTANGTAATESTPDKIIADLLSAMGGRLIRSEGKWIVRAGAWRPSSRTLAADDLVEGFKVAWRREPRDVFNGVKGTFVDPDGGWQATDYPSVAPAAFLAEDQNVRAWTSGYNLEFTTSPSMAQRLARIELERVRRQITTSLVCKLSCLDVKGGDTVAFDWPRYGWAGKSFEVVRFKFGQRSDGEAPSIVCEMEMAEIDANVYAWNAAVDEESMSPAPRTNLPSASTVAPPTDLVLSSGNAELDTRNDGTVFSRLKAAWTAPADAYVVSGGLIEIQYKKSADALWGPSEFTEGSATSYRILDVADGEAYDLRIRARNYIGATSPDWVTATNHVVLGKTDLPSDVAGFSAAANGSAVVLRWSAVADVDLDGYDLRYSAQSIDSWNAATPLSQATGATSITTIAIPPGDWRFYIKARDSSGNLSANAAQSLASVGAIPVSSTNKLVYTSPQAPDWLGLKTDCHVHWTGVLVPNSTKLASEITEEEAAASFNPYPVAEAIYEAPEIDLVYDSQVRTYAGTAARLGPGETAGAAICQLEQDYRLASGSYDGFEPWTIGTNDLRFAKQRIKLRGIDGAQVATEFAPTIDATTRSEEGVGVAVPAAGLVVTFERRFFSPPNVQVTPVGGGVQQAWAENITETGFVLKTANGAGAATAGNANWQAIGV
jgi:hypothetical protein